jgi:hypothetical protein
MRAASIKAVDRLDFALDSSRSGHWRISILKLGHLSDSRPAMLIKLNDKGVRVFMASGRTHYRNALDWRSRTGRIVKYSRNGSIAYVVWNGRSSYDPISVGLIEPATSLAPDIADALVGY